MNRNIVDNFIRRIRGEQVDLLLVRLFNGWAVSGYVEQNILFDGDLGVFVVAMIAVFPDLRFYRAVAIFIYSTNMAYLQIKTH